MRNETPIETFTNTEMSINVAMDLLKPDIPIKREDITVLPLECSHLFSSKSKCGKPVTDTGYLHIRYYKNGLRRYALFNLMDVTRRF